jgi:Zn-dependent M16 (insulinase) family peptidase
MHEYVFFPSERTIVDLLGAYLCDSSSSPMHLALVEGEEPFCTAVDYSSEDFKVH